MSSFELTALFMALVAVGGWINARTLKLPHGVAMLFVGLAGALAVQGLRLVDPGLAGSIVQALSGIDFAEAVLGYMLAFLLFAGAMQVDLAELRRRGMAVLTLATVGVVATTAVVGIGVWLAARVLGVGLPLA